MLDGPRPGVTFRERAIIKKIGSRKALLKAFIAPIALFLASLGGFGVFLLGILDGSLLFLPLGIDLLLVGLVAHHHDRWLYYALMAALGSTIGCFTTDLIGRTGGEEGLKKYIPKRRLLFYQKRVQADSAVVLALASAAPPGVPFSVVVLVAAAAKYPRPKLLGIVVVGRLVRFAAEGLLAIRFGAGFLNVARSPVFEGAIAVVIVASIVASGWALWSWRRTRA